MKPVSVHLDFDKSPWTGPPVRVRAGEDEHPVLDIELTDHGQPYEAESATLEVWHDGGHDLLPCDCSGGGCSVALPRAYRGVRACYVSVGGPSMRATTGDMKLQVLRGGPCDR